MSTNRKLTDFFKSAPPALAAIKKGDAEVGDVIIVDTTFRRNLENADERSGCEPLRSSKKQPTESAHNKIKNSKMFVGLESGSSRSNLEEQEKPSTANRLSVGMAGTRETKKTSRLEVKDSDAEDSDSDSSLEDIDVLLKKPNASTFSQRLPDRSTSAKPLTKSRSGAGLTETEHSLEAPRYKFSLASLVEQKQKDLASEAGAARARAALGSAQGLKNALSGEADLHMQDAEAVGGPEDIDVPHKGLLAAIVAERGDEGALQKVLNAMKRTEALNRDIVSYFFERSSCLATSPHLLYPNGDNLTEEEQYSLQDTVVQQQAYLSGFMADMSQLGTRLPEEVVEWILCDICSEPRDDLMYAYCEALKVNEPFNSESLSCERLRQVFKRLGGTPEATKLGHTARLVSETPYEDQDQSSINLAPVVQFLGENAENMSMNSKEYTVCIMSRMTVDPQVAGNGELLIKIEDAVASLVSGIPEERRTESLLRIGTDIAGFITYPPLQLQLINCLPLRTPCLHLFRRRLALTFFFKDVSYLTRRENDLLQIQRMIKRLRKPDFDIGMNTDYKKLSSMISILDIGIDNGISPSTLISKNDENVFNEDIDCLAESIKALFTKIFDTGASYMARTEAKAVLERVHYRLIYAVRTKERPKTSVFAKDEPEQSTMTQFLSKTSKSGDPTRP